MKHLEVAKGIKLRRFSVYVAGPVRDCASGLARRLQALEDALRSIPAADVLFMLFENDSLDDTRAVVERFTSMRPGSTLLTESGLSERIVNREERLAYCRNRLLMSARRHRAKHGGSADDIYLPIDLDFDLDWEKLAPSLAGAIQDVQSRNWDGIFPVSTPTYYDIHALRRVAWNADDAWATVQRRRSSRLSNMAPKWFWVQQHVHSKQFRASHLARLAAYVPVESAFGGLGVYRFGVVESAHYTSTSAGTCEHVAFNRMAGRLALRTDFVIPTPPEHIVGSSRRRFLRYASSRLLHAISWARFQKAFV